jgi:deoxycytidine triphosphate deaminase
MIFGVLNMLINPNIAIYEGWVTGLVDPDKQVQPNAIDFTVDTIFSIEEDNAFVINENGKTMRGGGKMKAMDCAGGHAEDGQYWTIEPHTVVDFMSNMYVDLPEGIAVTLIIRSTFNRNGLFLTSGLYDSGFKGHIAGALHNRSGLAYIAPGTRLGQICFWKSDSAGVYAGGYNHEEGTHHST